MSPKLGQAIVIENRPGGATNIGATAAAKADPDGHTLFTADNGTLVFNPALFRKLALRPQARLPPGRPDGPVSSRPCRQAGLRLDQRPRPDRSCQGRSRVRIEYASAGVGSPAPPDHGAPRTRGRRAASPMSPIAVPLQRLNDLVGGHVEAMVVDFPPA